MSVIVHHDKETYSRVNLKETGAYKYARDPSTDCLLTSGLVEWGRRDRERTTRRWRPGDRYPYEDIHPDDLLIYAWNSQFERRIWWDVMVPKYGWPMLELEQFICVAAQARICAAGPQKIDVAGRFFDRRHKKDNKGHQLMLQMCKPATETQQLAFLKVHTPGDASLRLLTREAFEGLKNDLDELAERCHHTPEKMDRLHDYCDQDVFTETDVGDILPPWNDEDLADFHENERINDRGVVVDCDFAKAACRYSEDEKRYFADEIRRVTNGAADKASQHQRINKWFRQLASDDAIDMMRWYDNGEEKFSLDADTRGNLLNMAATSEDGLEWIAHDPRDAEDLVDLLELVDAANKSSIAKYQAILNRAVVGITDDLPRVHGLYMFAGAAQSGRFSSTGLQAHNFIRDVPKNTLAMVRAFKRDSGVKAEVQAWADDKNAGSKGSRKTAAEPIHALGALVRPSFTGDPHGDFDLVWGDWSAIEACANPWLSLDPDADDRLATLRRGEDIYLKTASALCKRKITKDDKEERNAFGKVPELSLGYLGGRGAFKAMMRNYGVFLPDNEIDKAVKGWRAENPWADRFGTNCEKAAMAALRKNDGTGFSAGRLNYYADPDAFDGIGALFCILPSGREIPYPAARIQKVITSYGEARMGVTAIKAAWTPKSGTPWEDWPRVSLWKGLLIENATQAICADLLRLGLYRARKAGLAVCMHTHDEIMIETPDAERDAPVLHRLMVKPPSSWHGADMLPLRAEVETGYRYKVPFKEAA